MKSGKKIGIYSPYLDTLGGGEKYMLTLAEVLSETSEVVFFLGTHLHNLNLDELKTRVKKLHDIDLEQVNFEKGQFGKGSSLLNRILDLRAFDFFFYLTDGSIFFSTAKKNILHFQVPFKNPSNSIWHQIKLSSWDKAIYNSSFTKKIIEKTWAINGPVIYPPVSVEKFKPTKKKKQILSVGRFFGYLKDKKQEFMIKAFKEISKNKELDGWSLHLVGGAGEGDQDYVGELKRISVGFPIHIHPNLPFSELLDLYTESSLYWHAMGFNEDDPKKMEHFGISTVEAMAAGCVPIVIKKGGQVEIVEEGVTGLFWENVEELKSKTVSLIKDSEKLRKMADRSIQRSKDFSKEKFRQNVLRIING